MLQLICSSPELAGNLLLDLFFELGPRPSGFRVLGFGIEGNLRELETLDLNNENPGIQDMGFGGIGSGVHTRDRISLSQSQIENQNSKAGKQEKIKEVQQFPSQKRARKTPPALGLRLPTSQSLHFYPPSRPEAPFQVLSFPSLRRACSPAALRRQRAAPPLSLLHICSNKKIVPERGISPKR